MPSALITTGHLVGLVEIENLRANIPTGFSSRVFFRVDDDTLGHERTILTWWFGGVSCTGARGEQWAPSRPKHEMEMWGFVRVPN